MDIEKLIERLKCPEIYSCPIDGEYPSCTACQRRIAQEAADALARLKADAEGMRSNWYESVETIVQLRAELEQVKRERDAAVADLKSVEYCTHCAHLSHECSATSCKGWEWRGPQKEE